MENKNNLVNITPILEQIFSVAKIKNKEDLELLIKALEEAGDMPLDKLTTKEMAEIMERVKNRKAKRLEEKSGTSNIDIGQATIDSLRSAKGAKESDDTDWGQATIDALRRAKFD